MSMFNLADIKCMIPVGNGRLNITYISDPAKTTVIDAKDTNVYGEGQGIVWVWLREVAGQATEGSDGSLEN